MSQASSAPPSKIQAELASFWIRLLAYTYEWMIVLAIIMAGGAVPLVLTKSAIPPGTIWYELWLLALVFGYFGYCYTRSGQTVGMKPWRLMLTTSEGRLVDWRQAALRFALNIVLIGGLLGLLGMWLDRDGLALQDRLSKTRMVRLPPKD